METKTVSKIDDVTLAPIPQGYVINPNGLSSFFIQEEIGRRGCNYNFKDTVRIGFWIRG